MRTTRGWVRIGAWAPSRVRGGGGFEGIAGVVGYWDEIGKERRKEASLFFYIYETYNFRKSYFHN